MKKEHKRGISVPSRLIAAGLLILLQIAFFTVVALSLSRWVTAAYRFVRLLSFLLVFRIINKRDNPSYKLTWIIFIIAAPFVGGVLFFLWGNGKIKPKLRRKLSAERKRNRGLLRQNTAILDLFSQQDEFHCRQSSYLYRESGCPVYTGTTVEYLSPGENFLPRMLEEIDKAEKYIFLEYFIIAEGKMWNAVHERLRERAADGVEVRIIFDDFGSLPRQNQHFTKKLRAEGIKVVPFNRIHASVDLFLNNRDHRKMCIIDGVVSMTGGINIADEYINETHPHGNWMDCAVILCGEATTTFVTAFCEMWSCITKEHLDPANYIASDFPLATGYVQPYVDNPLDVKHSPGEGIYRQILGTAKDYVYIASPYLILDNVMTASLTAAAKAGIDIRIITPRIKDKWYVHPVTQYNYQELLEAGVRIFEYTPGFIHSKLFVSDDTVATCGTINMDYRSFYFHFECGVWMYGVDAVEDIKAHFLEIQSVSEEILLPKWSKRPLRQRFKQALLHIFAPFM